MNKFIVAFFLAITFVFIPAKAQEIKDVAFHQEGMKIVVNYNLGDVKYYQAVNIQLFVSMDGGKTFKGPLKKVSGDVGNDVKSGNNKQIVWDVLKEIPDFGGDIIFDVVAEVTNANLKKSFYLGYKGSTQAPFGITLGRTGKTGFYVSARLNTGFFTITDYETDGQWVTNLDEAGYYEFGDDDLIRRLSATAGVSLMVSRNVHVYVGAGITYYELLWHLNTYNYSDEMTGDLYASHTGEKLMGVEIESGLLYTFDKVFVGAGIKMCNFEWIEGSASCGILF